MAWVISLWWTKVLARSWGTRTGATGLFNAQSTTFDNLSLETLLGGISLFGSDHFDEAEATRLLGMGIKHNLTFFDVAILLEETGNFGFGETRMDTGDEKVGSGVDSAIILRRTTLILRRTAVINMTIPVWRCRSTRTTSGTVVATSGARRCTALTLITRSLVFVTSSILVFVIHGGHGEIVVSCRKG
jgi:hypothetical protein